MTRHDNDKICTTGNSQACWPTRHKGMSLRNIHLRCKHSVGTLTRHCYGAVVTGHKQCAIGMDSRCRVVAMERPGRKPRSPWAVACKQTSLVGSRQHTLSQGRESRLPSLRGALMRVLDVQARALNMKQEVGVGSVVVDHLWIGGGWRGYHRLLNVRS